MAFHNFGVEVLRVCYLLLVSFKSLLPGSVLGGVTVLDDAVVLLGDHVATVVKWLQAACEERSVPHQAVATQIDMSFHNRLNCS